MKYTKILTDVIKYVNKNKKTSDEWNFGYYGSDIYFIYKNYAIYRIPSAANPFRENYLKENLKEINITTILKGYYESNTLQKSGVQQLTDKIKYNIFTDNKGNKIYINETFLKYTDFDNDTIVKSIGKNTPVYFSECQYELDYIICPIKVEE